MSIVQITSRRITFINQIHCPDAAHKHARFRSPNYWNQSPHEEDMGKEGTTNPRGQETQPKNTWSISQIRLDLRSEKFGFQP